MAPSISSIPETVPDRRGERGSPLQSRQRPFLSKHLQLKRPERTALSAGHTFPNMRSARSGWETYDGSHEMP
jgi:hypothetical protein